LLWLSDWNQKWNMSTKFSKTS